MGEEGVPEFHCWECLPYKPGKWNHEGGIPTWVTQKPSPNSITFKWGGCDESDFQWPRADGIHGVCVERCGGPEEGFGTLACLTAKKGLRLYRARPQIHLQQHNMWLVRTTLRMPMFL